MTNTTSLPAEVRSADCLSDIIHIHFDLTVVFLVRALTALVQLKLHINWQPVLENCEVCSLHYKYISESTLTLNVAKLNRHIMYTADVRVVVVRAENMMEEAGYVLCKAGFSDGDTIMPTVQNQTIRDSEKSKRKSTGEYHRDIPQDMINSLRDM